MKLHANAALSFRQRERMVRRVVDQGWSVREAALAAEVSARTAGKWVARYRVEGAAGLLDRSSAPLLVANRSGESTIEAIAALRRLRFTGPEISEVLELPVSTVSGILQRIGMGRLGRLGMEPAERYERTVAGELIHIDVKKLGRIHGGAGKRITGVQRNPTQTRTDRDGVERQITGWEYVHIAIDDATRLAYAEVLPNEKATTAIAFLRRAVAFYERHGMKVQELLTDNGSPYPQQFTRSLAAPSASATYAPNPAGPRRMGRQRDSSAPCSPAGPTARSTVTAKNAQQPLTAGYGPTTIEDHTKPSGDRHPSPTRTTCSGLTARSMLVAPASGLHSLGALSPSCNASS
jgi:transposase